MQQLPTLRCVLALGALAAGAHAQQALLYSHDGLHNGGQLGYAVAMLADVDQDGVADYAVGAPLADPAGTGARPGLVQIRSGKTGALVRTLIGPGANSEFGAALAMIPDATGDGLPDLLVGLPGHTWVHSKQGAAYLYSSSTWTAVLALYGANANEHFGTSVATLGDLNGDGTDDWAVGGPFYDSLTGQDCGRVRVFSGVTLAVLQEYVGVAGELFGWSISGLGDVSLDGRDDFIVGAPGAGTAGLSWTGRAAVYLGGGGLWLNQYGSESYEQLGWSVCAVGDTNGDGKPEWAAGTPYFDGAGASLGRVLVLSGGNGQTLFQITGLTNAFKLGWALAPAGDFNGDTFPDLAVGTPGHQSAGTGVKGAVRIHSGKDGVQLALLTGYQDDASFGKAIAARDLNADGKRELLVGAPAEDVGAVNNGMARLFLSGVAAPLRYGTSKTNSLGCLPRIASSGAPSKTLGDNFHITASEVLPQTIGMLFWGFTQASTPFKGGWLHVGQPVVRTPAQMSGGTLGTCSGSYDFHFSQALMGASHLVAGMRLYAQYWSRDPGLGAPNDVGLTDALRFDIAP